MTFFRTPERQASSQDAPCCQPLHGAIGNTAQWGTVDQSILDGVHAEQLHSVDGHVPSQGWAWPSQREGLRGYCTLLAMYR